MSALSILTSQRRYIVLSASRQRTATERETIMRIRYSIQEPLNILIAGYHTWQTQQRHWRVIWVYTHIHIVFIACRHDSLKEIFPVGTQLISIDSIVQTEQFLEQHNRLLILLSDITIYKALSLHDDSIHQRSIIFRSHRLSHLSSFRQFIGSIVSLTTLTLQDILIEIHELHLIEEKARRTVFPWVIQFCASPVQHRHEIIADSMNAALTQISQTHLVILDELVAFRSTILDGFTYRQTLHHRPSQTGSFDIILHVHDSLYRPYFTILDVMQSSNNTFHANLTQHLQSNLVVLTEPTPCFFHNN